MPYVVVGVHLGSQVQGQGHNVANTNVIWKYLT